jgi:peptide deformylase
MAVREILSFDHPVLRQKAKKVARVDSSIVRLLDDLAETMYAVPGAGLAANQIGVPLRVCVVKGDDNQHYGLVNPVLVKGEGSQTGYEGCLSFPGWMGEVERHETVVVKGLNRKGKEVRIKSSGFTARAFQHEIDHLDGVLFTDRLTSLDTLRRVEEFESDEVEADHPMKSAPPGTPGGARRVEPRDFTGAPVEAVEA